ncbi:NF038143 family protein [Dehalobacterium formicoaceticum]|uniref:NF038143 family protein n=1 Tax=Dehalobacterium formicoaceticum TaxID=51515 RepID=A0ABT1Y441_9FIRM|nr:NF038143 family protein [Dehalobacterium formicoaceticum]MCR6545333.1 NF038143 family protein [Dehalobacterium formicoaceticum]
MKIPAGQQSAENYNSILAYENKFAREIAAQVMDKPVLSAWMILIPIVFVPYYIQLQRYKEGSKMFREGYLYTKRIAMDTAYRIATKELITTDAHAAIAGLVEKNPEANPIIAKIQEKQILEIEILCSHYGSLLATEKIKYQDMVRSYYQTKSNYLNYIHSITRAEQEVTKASTAAYQGDAEEAKGIMEKMNTYLSALRWEEAALIFPDE